MKITGSGALEGLTSSLNKFGIGGRQSMKNNVNAQKIYREYTKDFVLPGVTSYKPSGLKGDDSKSKLFSKRYDEPTYLTFRIEFDLDCIDENLNQNAMANERFNSLPHPLFNIVGKNISSSIDPNATASIKDLNDTNGSVEDTLTESSYKPKYKGYSTYDYLLNSLGEEKRANMLLQFIDGIYDIQTNSPYYFQSITGLESLLRVDPLSGRRVKEDARTITINCMEALDMRITQLMTLYRKVAWDDVYQRWMLPDMMRFFKMKIYISEMRLFHTTDLESEQTEKSLSSKAKLRNTLNLSSVDLALNVYDKVVSSFGSKEHQVEETFALMSSAINEVLPTICIDCEQCEFDISDTLSYLSNLSSSKPETKSPNPQIKILVRNIKETHVYSLNKNTDDNIDESNNIINKDSYIISDNELYRANPTSKYNTMEEKLYSTTLKRMGVDMSNQSYNVFLNNTTQVASYLGRVIDTNLTTIMAGIDEKVADVSKKILNTNIGNTGISINSAVNTLASGNIFTLYGVVKQAVMNSTQVYDAVSATSRTEIADEALLSVLNNISQSTATTDTENRFIQATTVLVNSGLSATDISHVIDIGFAKELSKLGSEANEDKDNGYVDVTMNNDSTSTSATNGNIGEVYDDTNKGLSNEAVQDTNIGYVNVILETTDVPSTATSRNNINNQYKPSDFGLSNEAITDTDSGFIDPNMKNPEYSSTANNGNIEEVYDIANKGLSNEAIQDTNNGYNSPNMENPKYTSTANNGNIDGVYNENLKGLSNEAVQDSDGGYTNPNIKNTEYLSSATNGTINKLYKNELTGLSNEAVDDTDKGFKVITSYNNNTISVATSRDKINL